MSSGSVEEKNLASSNGPIDLNERRRAALEEIDNAKFSCVFVCMAARYALTHCLFSWFHVKVCCVAGAGFFTDA
jgi:PHS family inorganic phosphate transporter-like MFS transporter